MVEARTTSAIEVSRYTEPTTNTHGVPQPKTRERTTQTDWYPGAEHRLMLLRVVLQKQNTGAFGLLLRCSIGKSVKTDQLNESRMT